jgi:ribulose-phosphate 3-epimerase
MVSQPIEIIPGIFEKDFDHVKKKALLVSPYVSWIQIDIADGKLVPNTSILDPEPFRELTEKNNFELHMMVEDPFSIIDKWIEMGFKRIIVHWNTIKNPKPEIRNPKQYPNSITQINNQNTDIIQKIRNQGIEVGIALDKDDSVESIFPFLDRIDCVMVMTIKAGFSGQTFMPELLEKVKKIKKIKPDLPVEVDGGINKETARLAIKAGATRLVSTSYIFNSDSIEQAIWNLKS